jgi:hypothetical protein
MDEARVRPLYFKLVALVSLMLWFGVGAAGRGLGSLDRNAQRAKTAKKTAENAGTAEKNSSQRSLRSPRFFLAA